MAYVNALGEVEFTDEEVQAKCESMGLEPYDEELYIALEALYCDYYDNRIVCDVLNDGVI